MAIEIGVQLERDCALEDAKEWIDERGDEIKLKASNEGNVVRDVYGSIKQKAVTEYTMNAFPIEFNPTDGQMEKAGIKENVDVIIYLAQLDLTNNSIGYETIDDIRWRVTVKGATYTIKDKNQVNMMADTYLNIALGLFRV